MIKKFRHVCITVSDLDKALKFYRDILGLRVFKTVTVEGEYPETVLNVKGVKLTYVKMFAPGQAGDSSPVFELHYWENPKISPRPGNGHISFTVADIDAEYERLTKLGVRFLSEPCRAPAGDTKICFCYAPDNHLIEFIEELKRA